MGAQASSRRVPRTPAHLPSEVAHGTDDDDRPDVVSERLREVLRALPVGGSGAFVSLCGSAADVVGVSGSGIMLMTDDVQRGSLKTTDERSAIIEDLQFEFSEGPCVDAYLHQHAILEPDLAAPAVERWPAFSPSAVRAGVGAIFGFPLTVGSTRLGSLNLYRTSAGPLSDEEEGDARRVADLLAIEMLAMQNDAAAGEVADGFGADADLQDQLHQATGMVAAQLDIGVEQALRALRAHARDTGASLGAVAAAVVERALRFDGEPEED